MVSVERNCFSPCYFGLTRRELTEGSPKEHGPVQEFGGTSTLIQPLKHSHDIEIVVAPANFAENQTNLH